MERSKRGVALLLTLVVSFFLVVLLGAFLVVNRGNSSLTVSGLKRQRAYNACLSGLHYVWGELELTQSWGADGFPMGVRTSLFPPGDSKLQISVHGDPSLPEDLNENYIRGELLGSSESFEVRFVNNLQNRHLVDGTQLGRVPGRASRIQVVGYSGNYRLTLDSVLRKKPFVDYSALSSDRMSVAVENTPVDQFGWRLRSKDPYINQVRSNTQIDGPSAIDGKIVFKEPPRGGVAKASTDILLDGTSVQSDPDFLNQSQRTAKGSFQVGTSEIDVPSLAKEDLRFPTEDLEIPAGTMAMKALEKHDWTSRDFDVDTDLDGIPDQTVTRWRLEKVVHQGVEHNDSLWVSETSYPLEDSGPLNSASDGFDSPITTPGFQDVTSQPTEFGDFPVLYGTDPEHEMRANLQTGEIALSSGTRFHVQGTLRFESEDGANQPNLLFGYHMDGDGHTDFSAGQIGNSAMEEPEENSAALVATESLHIDGIATGFGSIFAEDNVHLKAKSGLRASPDMAVAVHGDRITLEAEDPPDGEVNRLLDADFEFFREAMSSNFEGFEDWVIANFLVGALPSETTPTTNTGVRSRNLRRDGAYMWDKLSLELDLGPTPNFGSSPFGSDWSGELSLDHYIRLREYAKSGSQTWLSRPDPHFQSMLSSIDSQIGTYSRWSSLMGLSMKDFMGAEQPEIADVFFVGLVHAGRGGVRADTHGSSLLVEGALVSQGAINIEGAPSVDFVYNRTYLDDVIREFREDHIKLDQVYFKLN